MDELLKKLLALAGQGQPPPTPAPGDGIDAARPWDSPVLRPPAAATPLTPPATATGLSQVWQGGPAQTLTPEEEALMLEMGGEDALMQALKKKGINQQFAAATHNPIPG